MNDKRIRGSLLRNVVRSPLISIIVLLAWFSAPIVTAQTPSMVAVTYWKRACGMPGQLAEAAPVTVGKVLLQSGTSAPVTIALGSTPSAVNVAGSGPLTAKLVLETPRIKIVSGAGSTAAVTIDLKSEGVQGGIETFSMYLKEDNANGSIHALTALERAAEMAEKANRAPLPQLTARIFEAPAGLGSASQFDAPAAINVIAAAGGDDRWEPTPLIHEYGHFVMETVARGGPSGGVHVIGKSYPEMPDLAWTEGFASGFAGVVMKPEWSGLLFKQCGPYMSFNMPTRPILAPRDARYAQYNETRVAAATYNLVEYLGGGVPGLTRLFDAMKTYTRDGHKAWTARDLRDLAVESFEDKDPNKHAAIDGIFHMQGISWWQGFGLEVNGSEDYGIDADIEIVLKVTGPGGFDCHATSDIYGPTNTSLDAGREGVTGTKVADGGLAYSANDDCYLTSDDGVVGKLRPQSHTWGLDLVDIPFPYLPGLAHWQGPYTVTARYACARMVNTGGRPYRCPATFTVQLRVWNSWLIVNAPEMLKPIPVTLVKDIDMTVVTFKANGECKAIGKVDCGF